MGDGGCAVLISRPSLFEFYNPESCHADQARGRRVWAPELVPLKEASSDSGGSPSGLKGDDGELLWAPVGLCSMEPRPSSQGGEATKEKDEDSVQVVVYEDGGASTNTGNAGDLTMSRHYHSRWGNVVNHLTSPRRPQQTDEHNGSALGAEQGADWVTTPAAISHEQPQHPGNSNLSPLERSQEGYVRRVRGLEQSTGRSHSASGRDDTGEAKQIRVGDCGSQESFHSQDSFHASGKSNWKLKEIEEGRNKHSSSVGRHCHANITDKDVDFNSKLATSNYQDARQGNSHAFIGLKGKEEDHGSRATDWESNARQSHRDQGREAKERRSSNWEDQGDQGREAKERRSTNWEDQGDQGRETKERSSNWDDQDNLHPSGRGGWRGKENGVVWSYHGVTDGSREKEETRYRNADRDRGSHGGRQYSSSRDRVRDTGSSSGHFEGSTHRSSLERHASTDRSSYPRDYHGRDCSRRNPSDRSGSQRSSSDRPGGRQEGRQHRRESDSREYSGRHEEKHYRRQNDGREHRQWNGNGHARDRRQCRSWEERAADNRLNFPQDSLGNQYSHPDNGLVDESRHAGMEVPMDLSPAPLTVGDGSERPPELTRDMVSNLNCVEDVGSESVCNHGGELKSAGWIYLDSGGVMQGPMELGALKELLEKGKLQSDHLVSFDGGKEWVTLEHAGSPLEGCNSSLISASSGPNFLPQVKLDRDCKSHQQWLHPVEQALTVEDTRKQKGLGESLISEKDSPECSLTLEQTLPKKACTLTLEQTLPKKAVLPSEDLIDFRIDERVEHLMQGFALVPGKEKEAISDALSHATRLVQEDEVDLENEVSPRSHTGLAAHWKEDQLISDVQVLESLGLESQNSEDSVPQTTLVSITMMDDVCVNSFQSARKWTSRGGDWKLVCQPENTHIPKGQTNISSDRFLRTKVALNGGVPLCESWHSGLSDPRRQILDSSYSEALKRKRLELPPWIHRYFDERNECIRKIELCPESKSYTCLPSVATPKVSTPKSHVSTPVSHLSTTKGSIVSPLTDMVKKTKPVKGMAASRLEGQRMEHACMGPAGSKSTHSLKCGSAIPLKNPVLAGKYAQASLMISDTLIEQPEKMKHFGDTASDWVVQEKIGIELPQTLPSCALVESELDKFLLEYDKPSQQLATKGDLKLLKGDWYYKDGAGHENGPFSFANLQLMVEQGGLHDGTSVYRKSDDTWVSISVSLSCHETMQSRAQEKDPSPKLGGLIPVLKLTKPVLDVQAVTNDEYQAIKGRSAFPLSIQASGFSNEVITTPDLLTSSIIASLHVIDSHQLSPNRKGKNNCSSPKESTGFHQIYPQFMGYMCGKLHEHVMRSYKSRDCAATLDDCLEKWFSDKQSRSTMDPASVTGCPSVSTAGISSVLPPVTSQKCVSLVQTIRPLDGKSEVDNSKLECEISDQRSSAVQASTGFSLNGCEQSLHSKPQVIMTNDFDHVKNRRTGKRRRLLDIQESHVLSQPSSQTGFTSDSKSPFFKRETLTLDIDPEPNIEVCKKSIETDTKRNWMMLEPHLLMRIFRFLDGDYKSLVFASATCKSWRASVENSKNGIRQIDLSSLADFCNDSILESFTAYAGRQLSQLSKLILRGCTAVSPLAVKSLLQECPSISTVDITGCNQLKELTNSCLHIKWVGLCLGVKHHRSEDPPRRLKSLRLIGERKAPARRALEGSEVHSSDDSSGKDRMLKCEEQQPDGAEELLDFDSFHCMDRDSDTTQVASAHHVIKYMKVNDAQKILKFGSVHKLVPRECAVIDLHARENGNANTNDRKWKKESAAKPTKSAKAQFSMADKFTSSKSRGDLRTNGLCAGDRDKSIEKDMALVLKAVKEADTEKYFFYQVPDSKVTAGRALGLSDIEEKLRGGAYPGSREGVRNFKNDLFLLCRSAFHVLRKGSPVFKAGEEIFKLAYRLVSQLEKNSFAAPINEAHNLKQICNSDSISKGEKRKFRSGSNLLRRKSKGGDDVSRGRTGKRRRDIDESSADGDSQDSPSEKEGRRFPKIKKKQWTEWEVESSGTEEEDEVLFEEEEEETEESEADMESESEGDDEARDGDDGSSEDEAKYQDWCSREWGARMTHASMVPPITRKYEVIEEYVVVTAESDVKKRMQVRLPEDYDKKLQATRERKGGEYSHLEIPELKEYKPRKRLGQEVIEQEVYGIDPYTHNLLLDTMAKDRFDFSDARRQQLIEEEFLRALNKEAKKFTESGKAPMKYPLEPVVQRLVEEANDPSTKSFCQALLRNMQSRPKEKYVAYRKGLGVVCNKQIGFEKDDFVVEFFGEVYPAWRWFEKQDAIRSLQKKDKDPAPEFYNIFLERPRGDASGYDLVVVDAMHKANYASRICHSCRPNCEAKVTAVDGRYQIGVYTLRPVQYGEELTFDYNSVTESKEEYEASVCLCGSQGCRGSYLHLAGSATFQEVMKECHGLLHRHDLLLEACVANIATQGDLNDLKQAGLGSCLLEGLPNWAIGYAARVVRFINQERIRLPKELLKNIVKERRLESYGEQEMLESEVQADGVYNQRLQNLAITLDKVRYVFKEIYGDSTSAPPPLRKLEPVELVCLIWKGENSVVADLLRAMAHHRLKDEFLEFKRKVREHDPVESGNVEENLHQSLLWLRDELCKAPAACLSRHDAAADIIHMYAYTKFFFTSQDYRSFESPPLTINPLDLGPKYAHTAGSTYHQWSKTYNKDYVLGQLMFWYKQNVVDPGSSLAKARRGCLVLPDLSSCYAKSLHQTPRLGYGCRHRAEMFQQMEERPQKQWPKQKLWEFKNGGKLFGSPMMDAIRGKVTINREMMDWLKNRPVDFDGPWDN